VSAAGSTPSRATAERSLAYHLNEGHSALLTLQLLRRAEYERELLRPGEALYDIPAVREQCHFTTHTPVDAVHDRFPYDLVRGVLGAIAAWQPFQAVFAGKAHPQDQ